MLNSLLVKQQWIHLHCGNYFFFLVFALTFRFTSFSYFKKLKGSFVYSLKESTLHLDIGLFSFFFNIKKFPHKFQLLVNVSKHRFIKFDDGILITLLVPLVFEDLLESYMKLRWFRIIGVLVACWGQTDQIQLLNGHYFFFNYRLFFNYPA